jgi:2-oxoisovalerate ferredoxin oxidoreductase beta subunit
VQEAMLKRKGRFTIPQEEFMFPGHSACPGCGEPLAMRYLLKALGPRTILNVPAGCCAVIPGVWPRYALKVPLVDHAFECTAAVSSGIRAALEKKGIDDITVVGWAGDGGTVDIGLQALSGAVDRGTDFLYVMYDNEAYMNTGVQCSGATPGGAWTTTTPGGKAIARRQGKKRIMDMLVANGIVYGATVNVAYPENFVRAVSAAKGIRGPKFIHVYSPCPSGWRMDPARSIEVARLATQTNVFPLYEYRDGRYALTKEIKNRKPVGEYLRLQGRFKHLSPSQVDEVQRIVDLEYDDLRTKAGAGRR